MVVLWEDIHISFPQKCFKVMRK